MKTFSQEFGYRDLPQPLKLGNINQDFRIDIYNIIHAGLERRYISPYYHLSGETAGLCADIHTKHLRGLLNKFSPYYDDWVSRLEHLIMEGEFNNLLDLIQCILRSEHCSQKYRLAIPPLFQEHLLAYTIIEPNFRIIPLPSSQDGRTILAALGETKDKYAGAHQHLLEAGENINKKKWADSIRHSISAVEAVMKVVSGETGKDFNKALDKLTKEPGVMHPQLKSAFIKLYDYTNTEHGLRHALLEKNAQVELHHALFMFSACSACVTFIIGHFQK